MLEPIVNVDIGNGVTLRMLSIGDDVVAETYRGSGPGSFEPASLSVWFKLAAKSAYVIDVGAFTGIYALVASSANRHIKVAAVEPTKHVFSRLCLNIQLNGFQTQIAPLNFAAGQRVSDCLINHYDGIYCLGSGSTVAGSGHRPFWISESVRMLPLDVLPAIAASDQRFTVIQLPQTGPDLVKIDVEGVEIEVLAGMREMIVASLPIFIIECLSMEALRVVDHFLGGFGYCAVLIDDDNSSFTHNLDEYRASTRNILFYPNVKRQVVEQVGGSAIVSR